MAGAVARFALGLSGLVVGAAAVAGVLVVLDRLAAGDRQAERRALLARDAALNRAALAPGSALACLDAGAGEAVENGCEKAVFGSAPSTAAAVAYMDARLKLLSEAAGLADKGEAGAMAALAASRRAIELDRFGIAAHVLAARDGCTADRCDAFAWVVDAGALKANLRGQVFDQYVSRYADKWNEVAPQPKAPAVSQGPAAMAPVASIAPSNGPMPAPIKPGEKWDFPSAASIPPVSIMNKEPPLPKGAEASPQAPPAAQAATAAPGAVGQGGAAEPTRPSKQSKQPTQQANKDVPLPLEPPQQPAPPIQQPQAAQTAPR
jgi:hypothetical protein